MFRGILLSVAGNGIISGGNPIQHIRGVLVHDDALYKSTFYLLTYHFENFDLQYLKF